MAVSESANRPHQQRFALGINAFEDCAALILFDPSVMVANRQAYIITIVERIVSITGSP